MPSIDNFLPPSAIWGEQAILGALLRDGHAAYAVVDNLLPEHFAAPLHGLIYQAVAARHAAGRPVDAVAMAEEAERLGALDDVGGAAYFQQLLSHAARLADLDRLAHEVYAEWLARQDQAAQAARRGRPIPDARDHRASHSDPIHCTLHALELETLADHHESIAAEMRDGTAADLMRARAAELRRLAERARAGK